MCIYSGVVFSNDLYIVTRSDIFLNVMFINHKLLALKLLVSLLLCLTCLARKSSLATGSYETISENTFYNIKCSHFSSYTSEHSMYLHKFSWKKEYFLFSNVKTIIFYAPSLFTHGTYNPPPPQILVCTHRSFGLTFQLFSMDFP
jgi:hypothetical protein